MASSPITAQSIGYHRGQYLTQLRVFYKICADWNELISRRDKDLLSYSELRLSGV